MARNFISSLMPYAVEESKRTGIDPRIIVAQAALESGWGRKAPGNNLFGIKSHGQGGGQTFTTHEVIDGKRVKTRDRFREYGSPAESVRGYGDFILNNPRYTELRNAQGLDAQIDALQRSGYATDPKYGAKIRSIAANIKAPGIREPHMGSVGSPQDVAHVAAGGRIGAVPPMPIGSQGGGRERAMETAPTSDKSIVGEILRAFAGEDKSAPKDGGIASGLGDILGAFGGGSQRGSSGAGAPAQMQQPPAPPMQQAPMAAPLQAPAPGAFQLGQMAAQYRPLQPRMIGRRV